MFPNILSSTAKLAFDTLDKDTIILLNEEPLYAYLIDESRTVFTRNIDVAMVSMENGDLVLYINPEGYLVYPKGERLWILKHEYTHWIDEHPLQSRYYERFLWNLACDISINPHLATSTCHLPPDAQVPEMYELPSNLSPEQYYDLLLEKRNAALLSVHKSITSVARGDQLTNQKPDKKTDKPLTLKGMITKKKKLSNGLLLIRLDVKMLVFSDEQHFYNQESLSISFSDLEEGQYAEALFLHEEGGYAGLTLKLIEKPKEEDQSSQQAPGNSPHSTSPSFTHPSLEDLENLHPQWEDANGQSPHILKDDIQQKVNNAILQAGNFVPEHLIERLKQLQKGSTDWKGRLRIFIGSQKGQKKIYTYRKRNRRIPFAPGIKRGTRLKLAIVIDTSASVSLSQLEVFDAELRRIYQMNRDIQIIVIVCDQVIRDVFEYNQRRLKEQMEFSGRGGTDFRPPFELIQKRDHKLLKQAPNAILYLTDGGGIAPETFPIPTLWCLTENGHLPLHPISHQKIEWGQVIKLSES
ncbi:hypothetical protein CN918_27135 [Priestia megaterium]|nr:hypothetical protein CN918_27135 [Priestia megaterium]